MELAIKQLGCNGVLINPSPAGTIAIREDRIIYMLEGIKNPKKAKEKFEERRAKRKEVSILCEALLRTMFSESLDIAKELKGISGNHDKIMARKEELENRATQLADKVQKLKGIITDMALAEESDEDIFLYSERGDND